VVVVPVLRSGGGGGANGANGTNRGNGDSSSNSNARVLAYASRVAEELRSDGSGENHLTTACFSSKSARATTPAATRAALERAGVPLRADVGAREASGAEDQQATVSLALHPALELSLPEEEAAAAPSPVLLALQSLRDRGRADGVPLAHAAKVCRRALDAAREAACGAAGAAAADNADDNAEWPPKLEAAPTPEEEEQQPSSSCSRRRRRRPDLLAAGWCDRLHLRCCATHARWMLGLVPGPCYCGGVLGEHPEVRQLLASAERALEARQQRSWVRRGAAAAGRQQEELQAVWSPSPPREPPPPERCCLFVSGLDPRASAAQARGTILAALAPLLSSAAAAAGGSGASFRVAPSKGPSKRTHGWARVTVSPASLADAAIAALSSSSLGGGDGGGSNDGRRRRPLCLTASRSLGRVDALFPRLPFEARLRLRVDPVASFSVMDQPLADRVAGLLAALAEAVAVAAGAASAGQQQHAVDACACAGGSALALAQRFARVTAVELDADRADDLLHNFAVAARWRANDGGGGGGVRPRWWVEMRQPEEEGEHEKRRAVVACADALRLLLQPEEMLGLPLPPGLEPGAPPVDVVFFDPPWGGPQYHQDAAGEEEDDDDDGEEEEHPPCHAPVVVDGASDLSFAGAPLSATAAELLSSGRCRLVAVRLPARAVDARGFAARVSRRVAEQEEREGGKVTAVSAAMGRSLLMVVARAAAEAVAAAPAAFWPSALLREYDCSVLL
jgi:hypothetical protein